MNSPQKSTPTNFTEIVLVTARRLHVVTKTESTARLYEFAVQRRNSLQALIDAIDSGAELVVSACTISHVNLDSYQSKAGRVSGKNTIVPVCHLSEIVAFALGFYPDRFAQLRTRVRLIGS